MKKKIAKSIEVIVVILICIFIYAVILPGLIPLNTERGLKASQSDKLLAFGYGVGLTILAVITIQRRARVLKLVGWLFLCLLVAGVVS